MPKTARGPILPSLPTLPILDKDAPPFVGSFGILGILRPKNLFAITPPPSNPSAPTPPFLSFSPCLLRNANPFSVRSLSSTSLLLSVSEFFSKTLSSLKLFLRSFLSAKLPLLVLLDITARFLSIMRRHHNS